MTARSAFASAFASWSVASAAVDAFDAGVTEGDDAVLTALMDKENEAAWAVIRANAVTTADMTERARFTLAMHVKARERGESADNREFAALLVLVSDVLEQESIFERKLRNAA